MRFVAEKIKSIFCLSAMSDTARAAFEADIQASAKRSGFKFTDTSQNGERIFKREADGATVTMPKKEDLRRRDKIRLHGFDGYL